MGDEMFPVSFSVIFAVLIAAQFLLGLVLNLGIQISALSQQIFQVKSGNLFVRTLGWIDALICLTLMPCTFVIIVLFPRVNIVLCAVHEGVISMSISATTTCVLFISLDRYGAIVTPTSQRLTHRNVLYINILIGVASVLGFLFPLVCLCFVTSIDVLTQMTSSGMFCRDLLLNANSVYIYEVYFISLASVSTITTAICYVKIYRTAKKRMKARQTTVMNNEGERTGGLRILFKFHERKTVWLSLAIVFTFFLSWGPYILIAILQILMHITLPLEMSKMGLLSLGMISTVLHPIFYTFLNRRESRRDQMKRIMIDAGSGGRLREYRSQQETTSAVQSLVHKTISQSISIGVGNKHDMEIFTTCQEPPKTSSSETDDEVFEHEHSHLSVSRKLFSGRKDRHTSFTDHSGRESSISEASGKKLPLSFRLSIDLDYVKFQSETIETENCAPEPSTTSLSADRCQTNSTLVETADSVSVNIESDGRRKARNSQASVGQYTNAAFEP
ncbi:G-protein coupled receptor 22-like [Ylistrum balloti]|uniref:G-protein coupled receptor 22-like n=1 Tax=Ylistrum balloti TaxID=509963 RepID=UPI002905AF4F|nr:G-protein coupled receptor 22-like [Ylistrum balloti]